MLRSSVNTTYKVLLKTNVTLQNIPKCKMGSLTRQITNVCLRNNSMAYFSKRYNVSRISVVRHQSQQSWTPQSNIPPEVNTAQVEEVAPSISNTSPHHNLFSEIPEVNTAQVEEVAPSISNTFPDHDLLSEIPDPPALGTAIQQVTENLAYHWNGEPTLASLGLGGYSPSGMVMSLLEKIHIGLDVPWWAAIVIVTVCVRLLVFPLVIKSQKNVVALYNVMPKVQRIQSEMTEARQCGNDFEVMMLSKKLQDCYQENDINPLKNFSTMIVQIPIFASFYTALTTMSSTPVESMKTGGLWWFPDLTIADPYYLLPLFTCATLLVTLEVGADGATMPSTAFAKIMIRGIPLMMFPVVLSFSSNMTLYWLTSNLLSLGQVLILRIPRVRTALNIPEKVIHDMTQLPQAHKPAVDTLKEFMTNLKIARDLAAKQHADSVQFNNAGREPIKKTYAYDPTKQYSKAQTIVAKKN